MGVNPRRFLEEKYFNNLEFGHEIRQIWLRNCLIQESNSGIPNDPNDSIFGEAH
jgi:hypothetical protein